MVIGLAPLTLKASPARVLPDISYRAGAQSDYERERCKLDLYVPAATGFPTLVWFHGGGLKTGDADLPFTAKIAQSLADEGIGFVVVRYRYSPRVTYPAYVEDAAAAFAWTVKHIAAHGGDPRRVFMGGHSAGGYLATLAGLDGRYLQAHGLGLDSVAGLIPVSGQMLTHYTVREERGLQKYNVISDAAAPVYHSRPDTPPLLVLYADKDMATRMEENVYFVSTMKAAGNKGVRGVLVKERDHGSIARNLSNPDDPGRLAVLQFIKEISSQHGAP
jgi:acetyl esterase/lipase